ncbi:hypothetical protein [Peribacillus cavernae]|nr:hypothetical protein [Peribacillus cavernae]MDQ0218631.1 hypothetical protein [Peribacillus cavernae]
MEGLQKMIASIDYIESHLEAELTIDQIAMVANNLIFKGIFLPLSE